MKRRVCAILLAASLAVCGLTGCGNGSQSSAGQEKVRLMVWSPSEDQSKESGEWLQTMCESFAEENPQWDITFVYGVADEATAASQVSQDPEASADVFMYANDTLTTMTDANALAKFGGKYREEIEKTNSEEVLKSLTKDGDLYGIPFTTNTWFMYYDKSVFSEEDVKNLDTMLEKGVVSFPFTNSWYLPAFYVGNGCTLFGDGTDESKGVDFGGENAVEVTNYLIDLRNNPNFKIDADGSGIAGLRDGSINAMFSGSWDANAVKEALHYEMRNVIPCNTELLAQENIAADPLVMAQNDTFNQTSILQPFVSKMNNCWVPVENMGKGIRNGNITHENAKEQTESMNEAMNSDGI